MAAGTTPPTKLMDRIKVVLTAVTGIGASRIYQGKKVFGAAEDFEATVRGLTAQTQGAFWYWIANRLALSQTTVGSVRIRGGMAIRLPRETSSDCNAMYDFLESVATALNKENNFCPYGVRPRSVGWTEGGIEGIASIPDDIALFSWEMNYEVGITS